MKGQKRNDLNAILDEEEVSDIVKESVKDLIDYAEAKFDEIQDLLRNVNIDHFGNITEAYDLADSTSDELY